MPCELRQGEREQLAADVRRALAEDLGTGDLTAALLDPGTTLEAEVLAREDAVLCGRDWFTETFAQLDPALHIAWVARDGDVLEQDQRVCTVSGAASPLLSGERTALNFLQTLSGTATITRRYASVLEGTGVRLLDTRKTLPGLRLAQKYAVRCGGGENHRIGLFDAYLIKENHIAAAGSIGAAVARALAKQAGPLVEVEVESLEQLREALDAGAQRALLDNFDLATLREAVKLARGRIELEASGNITLDSLLAVADTGVSYISIGALTKHLRAVDYSMRFLD